MAQQKIIEMYERWAEESKRQADLALRLEDSATFVIASNESTDCQSKADRFRTLLEREEVLRKLKEGTRKEIYDPMTQPVSYAVVYGLTPELKQILQETGSRARSPEIIKEDYILPKFKQPNRPLEKDLRPNTSEKRIYQITPYFGKAI